MSFVADRKPSRAPSMNDSYTFTFRTTPKVSIPKMSTGTIHDEAASPCR